MKFVVEMRMLRWMCGHTRKDKIRNEDIRGKSKLKERGEKIGYGGLDMCKEGLLTLRFEDDYETEVQGRRGRGRPKKTLEETLRKDLEYLDLTEDMTQN
ncbi:hypothetical protein DVH24_011627 [Malus domestica]|uniref:Uncharacterized protein n=1 Tax=Malus domestica TaxID=3750 RepID=A0A498K0P4_MALDO|nr:hypothetical protein DVH24_011627 [Malus domestica]